MRRRRRKEKEVEEEEEETQKTTISNLISPMMGSILATSRAIRKREEKEVIVDEKVRMIKFGNCFLRLAGGKKTARLIPQRKVKKVDERYAFVLESSDTVDFLLMGRNQAGDLSHICRIRATRRGKDRFLWASSAGSRVSFERSVGGEGARWMLNYVPGDKTTIHPVAFPHLCLLNDQRHLCLRETDSVQDRSHHAWFPRYRRKRRLD